MTKPIETKTAGTGPAPRDDTTVADGAAAKSPFSFGRLIAVFSLLIVAVAVAAAFRLPSLENRTMHCDEAVHAAKLQGLLEQGEYAYDPHEYHGPSLNYATLPVAWMSSAEKLTELTEVELRLVPAFFGIGLVALVFLLREELGTTATFFSALFMAVSPIMVFYSRYYIQEMLLVFFTFSAIVALWRYARLVDDETNDKRWLCLRKMAWLVLLGGSIGMMHASKETCVIALFSMFVAAAITMPGLRRMGLKRIVLATMLVLATAAGVSALFFSSFFDNPGGVADSYATYFHYFTRAAGEGSAGQHEYPFYHYFHRLFYWESNDPMLWTEATVGVLALLALLAAVTGMGLRPKQLPIVRFLSVYTLSMTVIYCAIPYKTPWCALGFFQGMILMAGIAAGVMLGAESSRPAGDRWPRRFAVYAYRACAGMVLLGMAAGLGMQAWLAAFVDYENPTAPYVYAHATSDLFPLVDELERLAEAHPDGKDMHVQVICPDGDFWPLPWYLRSFGRVGWFSEPPKRSPAPVIVMEPSMRKAVNKYLYLDQPPGKRPLYADASPGPEEHIWQLRPGAPLEMFVLRSFWLEVEAAEKQ